MKLKDALEKKIDTSWDFGAKLRIVLSDISGTKLYDGDIKGIDSKYLKLKVLQMSDGLGTYPERIHTYSIDLDILEDDLSVKSDEELLKLFEMDWYYPAFHEILRKEILSRMIKVR